MFRPGNPMPSDSDHAVRAFGHRRTDHGQPRPEEEVAPGPTAAERVRTLVEGNASSALIIPGVESTDPYLMVPQDRTVDRTGDVLLRMPTASPAFRAAVRARDDELVGVLELTDVAPVAVPGRVRGRASVAGWLTPYRGRADGGWLRLETGELSVDDLWGAAAVEPDEFAAAEPDPLTAHEAELLQHLAAAHGDQVARLGALAGCADRREGPGAAIPVALDRGGLRVRFTGAGGTFDARFAFPAPVDGVPELRRAMHALFDQAREAAGLG